MEHPPGARVYHYTTFPRTRAILLAGRGLDPRLGQWYCHEYPPGRARRGIRALVEADPPTWRRSPVFGDYTAMLMGLVEDRLCLEVDVADGEADVVERATVEGYMHALNVFGLPGEIPDRFRFFSRRSAEEALWASRVPPSRRDLWSGYLLPKVIVTAAIPSERIRVAREQPYLFDPRWATPQTRSRADLFAAEHPPFAEVLAACAGS